MYHGEVKAESASCLTTNSRYVRDTQTTGAPTGRVYASICVMHMQAASMWQARAPKPTASPNIEMMEAGAAILDHPVGDRKEEGRWLFRVIDMMMPCYNSQVLIGSPRITLTCCYPCFPCQVSTFHEFSGVRIHKPFDTQCSVSQVSSVSRLDSNVSPQPATLTAADSS